MTDLFSNYTNALRPVEDTDHIINVTLQITLSQIIDMVTISNPLCSMFLSTLTPCVCHLSRMSATRSSLRTCGSAKCGWTPTSPGRRRITTDWMRSGSPAATFGGQILSYITGGFIKLLKIHLHQRVSLQSHDVLHPLHHSADDEFSSSMETNVVLRNDGQVMWDQPAITKSSCSVDVAHFPFDLQECHLTFGSWTHNGNQMDLFNALDSADLADFVPNVEWEVSRYHSLESCGKSSHIRVIL